ncbi:MAG: glycosyltransferase family A protein [Planctomycetota bacterium]
MPSVTIVMACHNGMPYLPDALDSIRCQSFSDWELIVVNDGSADGSCRCLDEFARRDPRIRVIHQANRGQHVAADCGIRLARGEFIARMDADDVCQPNRLEMQVRYLRERPEVGLVGGQICRLGAQRHGLQSNLPTDHLAIRRRLQRNHHAMCNPTVMFRKSLYDRVGGYWSHNIAEDWDLFLRIGEISELANLPDVVLHYRFHTSSINGKRIVQAQLYNEFAAHLSRLRESGTQEVSFEEFRRGHAVSRWPHAWFFYADALSIGQYREAVAEILCGKRMTGGARLLLAMAMSPARTWRRFRRMMTRIESPRTSESNSGDIGERHKTMRPSPITSAAVSSFEHSDGVGAQHVESA